MVDFGQRLTWEIFVEHLLIKITCHSWSKDARDEGEWYIESVGRID